MKLSPRWRKYTKAERSAHMSALATRRMRKLSKSARTQLARDLVAAREAKRHDQKNNA